MDVAIATAAIAVLGTLLGAIVTARLQDRTADRADRSTRAQEIRREQLAAVTDLAAALSDHRRAMFVRGEAKLSGANETRVQELRDASHATRSAVTRPHVALRVVITDQAVRAAADAMVTATYAMRDASTPEALDHGRRSAIDAHDAFVNAAAAHLQTA
ncbi:hypothetical protein ABT391_36815 [Streptomyces jumonjinensis]|uniref:hypothetical protein n=1 Tax=Streptomyces jumonjinensis TaxID=1945 RepID=UPI003325CC90